MITLAFTPSEVVIWTNRPLTSAMCLEVQVARSEQSDEAVRAFRSLRAFRNLATRIPPKYSLPYESSTFSKNWYNLSLITRATIANWIRDCEFSPFGVMKYYSEHFPASREHFSHIAVHCSQRKRTLRGLSRYWIAATVIDRADNGESCAAKGTECTGIAYNERNSRFVRAACSFFTFFFL